MGLFISSIESSGIRRKTPNFQSMDKSLSLAVKVQTPVRKYLFQNLNLHKGREIYMKTFYYWETLSNGNIAKCKQ